MPANSSPPRACSAFRTRRARRCSCMIAHVWGMLVPVGEFAARTNLLSALFSAAGAGCFFLVVHESLAATPEPRAAARRGAAAGALLGGVHLHQLAELQRDRGLRRRDVHHRRDVVAGAACGAAAGGAAAPAAAAAHRLSRRDLDRQPSAGAAGGPRHRGFLVVDAAADAGRRTGRRGARNGARWRSWPASGRC